MKQIFDGLYVNQLFQKNERGETIYYPFGLMGRGYLLPAEREAGVRSATRWLMVWAIMVGVGGVLIATQFRDAERFPPAAFAGFAALLVMLGLITWLQLRLVADLAPASAPRPSLGEWFRRGRMARAPWTYWTSIVLGSLVMLGGAADFAFAVVDGMLGNVVSGAFLLLIGALLTWDGALGLIERSRTAKAG